MVQIRFRPPLHFLWIQRLSIPVLLRGPDGSPVLSLFTSRDDAALFSKEINIPAIVMDLRTIQEMQTMLSDEVLAIEQCRYVAIDPVFGSPDIVLYDVYDFRNSLEQE